MALGALTLSAEVGKSPSDPVFHETFTMVGDGAYVTGGSSGFAAAFAALFPLRSFDASSIVYAVGTSATHTAEYIRATDALKVYVRATGVEAANTVDLSGQTFQMYVVAR